MCGISGYISKDKFEDDVLYSMIRTLSHRGPDGINTRKWQTSEGEIGLAHARLAIIDLSTHANQPMSFDGLHIVFNGEIYNYNKVKEELELKGHQFQTTSDTEVILHSIREWGTDAIKRWHGMFSIVLYDEKDKSILCIRDRAGVKPFFYYRNDKTFIFSSELKAFFKHPSFEKKLDKKGVASYLRYGYISWPHSIWENTYKLPPGHVMRICLQTGDTSISSYWNVYDYYCKPKLKIDFQDGLTITEDVLKTAIDYRMVADVPVGVFLSGGYDSACVAALLQKDRTEKIKTFTIGMHQSSMDEAPYAKKVAEHLGTDHTEYYCSPAEAISIIPELPEYFDEPFADSSCIPTILVSRLARQHVTVALSADAGDEVFAGYDRYHNLIKYFKKIDSVPRIVRKALSSVMEVIPPDRIPGIRNHTRYFNQYKKLKNQLANHSLQQMMYNLTMIFTESEIDALLNFDTDQPLTAHDNVTLLHKLDHPLDYLMAVDYQTYLTDDILHKVDRATMSCSLEGREPLVDHSVIEWAAQLPDEFKYKDGVRKYVLKEIVHQYLPKNMMDRKKMGFAIPIADWMQGELNEIFNEYLSDEKIKKAGVFNSSFVKAMMIEFKLGKTGYYLKLWHIFMFQLWFEKWMKV